MKKKKFIYVALVSLIHFALTWISLTYVELIHPSPHHVFWQSASSVLGFPLAYAANLGRSFDIAPLLLVANSILWGIAIVALASLVQKRRS